MIQCISCQNWNSSQVSISSTSYNELAKLSVMISQFVYAFIITDSPHLAPEVRCIGCGFGEEVTDRSQVLNHWVNYPGCLMIKPNGTDDYNLLLIILISVVTLY